ncbi:MAG: ribosome biogenesis GTP-binding protein YihA/YsxC [Myxococcota bacterium]
MTSPSEGAAAERAAAKGTRAGSSRSAWRVTHAQFLQSAPAVEACPPGDRPEIAIAGRSNVGKSSLLNALTGRRGLARVSRTPGRTQLLNVFDLTLVGPGGANRALRCVDLPGYGFAATHRRVREGFAPMIEGYLSRREALRALVLLVDARRGALSELDRQLLEFVSAQQRPTLLVVTKIDKLGASARGLLRRRLATSVGARPRDVVLTSARTGAGLTGPDGLVADLAALCEPEPPAAAG